MRRLLRGPPWVRVLLWVVSRVAKGWRRLEPHERSEFGRLLAQSRGRPGRLSESDRERLRLLTRAARGKRRRRSSKHGATDGL